MTNLLEMPPPEWAPQDILYVGWPSHVEPWETIELYRGAQSEIAALVQAIQTCSPSNGMPPTRPVLVVDGARALDEARELAPGVEVLPLAIGDVWLRDTGPIFSRTNDQLTARCFRFNGWGGKYIYPNDDTVSERMAEALKADQKGFPFIMEGGSVDWDGAGNTLTTRECLLNPNRNSDWTEADAEDALKTALGAQTVHWIDHGLIGDHTDGHIDNIARFVAPGHVLVQSPAEDDPQTDRLLEIIAQIEAKPGLTVSHVTSPGRVLDDEGEEMPASHLNFVITNQVVVVPTYSRHGATAVEQISRFFPDREVIGLPASTVLTGGGSFHCISQQVPA